MIPNNQTNQLLSHHTPSLLFSHTKHSFTPHMGCNRPSQHTMVQCISFPMDQIRTSRPPNPSILNATSACHHRCHGCVVGIIDPTRFAVNHCFVSHPKIVTPLSRGCILCTFMAPLHGQLDMAPLRPITEQHYASISAHK